MEYMNIRSSLRTNKDIERMMKELMDKFPDKFDSKSHLIRCALITIHRELIKDGKNKSK